MCSSLALAPGLVWSACEPPKEGGNRAKACGCQTDQLPEPTRFPVASTRACPRAGQGPLSRGRGRSPLICTAFPRRHKPPRSCHTLAVGWPKDRMVPKRVSRSIRKLLQIRVFLELVFIWVIALVWLSLGQRSTPLATRMAGRTATYPLPREAV